LLFYGVFFTIRIRIIFPQIYPDSLWFDHVTRMTNAVVDYLRRLRGSVGSVLFLI